MARVQKTHFINHLPEFLEDALWKAFEETDCLEGVWAQKYEENGETKWEASIHDYLCGKSMLKPLELEGIKRMFEKWQEEDGKKEGMRLIIDIVEDLIVGRWDEKNTIEPIIEAEYLDEYDEYCVNRMSFI